MHPLLKEACAEADILTARALGADGRWASRLSPRGTVANAAPRITGRSPAAFSLAGSWFSCSWEEGGFLNFSLSPAWFSAAAEQLPEPDTALIPPLPPSAAGFPARICPRDWRFLTLWLGHIPAPAQAARQDSSNPGWLVRRTANRLETLETRCPAECGWTEREQALLLEALRAEAFRGARNRAQAQTRLAERIWRERPETIPQPVNRFLRAVLQASPEREWFTENSPNNQENCV